MAEQTLEADYVIIGAGATAMAFSDAILTESDAMLTGKFHHSKRSLSAHLGLQGPRLVINAGMQNPAVTTAGMRPRTVFFFENQNGGGRIPEKNFPGGCQADNPGAGNNEIMR